MRFVNGITSPEEAYWFGFLVGDGCIYENRYRLKLNLQNKDKGHLESFARFLGYDNNRIFTYGSMSEFRVDNKELLQSLYNLGLCQNKVRKTSANLIPKTFSRHFVRGLFDADGTIHLSRPGNYLNAEFHICGTKNLLGGIKSLLIKEIDKINRVCITKGKGCYTLKVGGRWIVQEVGNFLYEDSKIHLQRKFDLFQMLFDYNKVHERMWKKLTDEQISDIKKMSKLGKKQNEIGDKFNISQSLVSRIVNGKRYSKSHAGLKRGDQRKCHLN